MSAGDALGFKIRTLSSKERQALAPARAVEWRGALCESQFVDRNRVLYSGDFARARIRSFGLFLNEKSILPAASCDLVQGEVLSRAGKAKAQVLASVLTLPEFQKRGLGRQLLTQVFSQLSDACFLYSDIGPDFYRRYGFAEDTWEQVIETSGKPHPSQDSSPISTPISRAEFCRHLERYRQERIHEGKCDFAFLPDEGWVEWVEAKYRYYTSLSGKGGVHYAHVGMDGRSLPVAFAADFLNDRVDVLWAEPEAVAVWRPMAWTLATDYGLKAVRYWARNAGGQPTWPMFRPISPAASTGLEQRLDLHLGDWW